MTNIEIAFGLVICAVMFWAGLVFGRQRWGFLYLSATEPRKLYAKIYNGYSKSHCVSCGALGRFERSAIKSRHVIKDKNLLPTISEHTFLTCCSCDTSLLIDHKLKIAYIVE